MEASNRTTKQSSDGAKTVEICMISDDDSLMPTCVAIQSLLMTKDEERIYRISIITPCLSEKAEDQLQALATDTVQIAVAQAGLCICQDTEDGGFAGGTGKGGTQGFLASFASCRSIQIIRGSLQTSIADSLVSVH